VKKVFGIDQKAFINMSSTKDRTNIDFDELDDRTLGIMIGLAEAVIYPCDSNKLVAMVASKLIGEGRKVSDTSLLKNTKSPISVLPLKSVQHQVLMATICATYPRDKTQQDIDIGVKKIMSSHQSFGITPMGEEMLHEL
jgi:hypothetical protein